MLDEVPVAFVLVAAGMDGGPRPRRSDHGDMPAELAQFKVPHEVRLVDELPRSTLEKVAKAELRRRLDLRL